MTFPTRIAFLFVFGFLARFVRANLGEFVSVKGAGRDKYLFVETGTPFLTEFGPRKTCEAEGSTMLRIASPERETAFVNQINKIDNKSECSFWFVNATSDGTDSTDWTDLTGNGYLVKSTHGSKSKRYICSKIEKVDEKPVYRYAVFTNNEKCQSQSKCNQAKPDTLEELLHHTGVICVKKSDGRLCHKYQQPGVDYEAAEQLCHKNHVPAVNHKTHNCEYCEDDGSGDGCTLEPDTHVKPEPNCGMCESHGHGCAPKLDFTTIPGAEKDSKYYFCKGSKSQTHDEAAKFCQNHGAKLATFETLEEQKAISDYANKKHHDKTSQWWLNFVKVGSVYRWGGVPDGVLIPSDDKKRWCKGEPSNHDPKETCGHLKVEYTKEPGCLNNLRCDHKFWLANLLCLCEKKLEL